MTRVTKAIQEEDGTGALLEFCNLLGISPQMLDRTELMGTDYWDVFVCSVEIGKFADSVAKFNMDPIRADFRAGRPEWMK